uniref:Peptidase S1 domain-containing protein n=1 Tax=Anopheles epiroticus TaxID=199890 RepID=A0A182PQY4_9DIPT
MDRSLRVTLNSRRCLVFAVLLLLTLLACCLSVAAATQPSLASYKRCSKGICVRRETCLNGQINTVGHMVIEPRMLGEDDIDECDKYGLMCCGLPEDEPVTTSTTEKPEDPDWSRQCGQRTDVDERTDQENETNRFEFPWHVAVFSVTKILGKLRKEFLCGGTLIDDYLVVTAARCVHQRNRATLVVQIGRWDLDARQEPRTQQIAVESLTVHRGYVPSSHLNNIALLELTNGVQLGRAANRVCLPDHTVQFDTDSLCYVVGWSNFPTPNTPNRQLKLRSTFAPARECTDSIRRATGAWEFRLPKENICPAYLDDSVPCERAPGSGMVCESSTGDGQYFLVGVASYAVRNCDKFRAHDVFLKVTAYIPWIDNQVEAQGRHTSFYRPDPSSFEET